MRGKRSRTTSSSPTYDRVVWEAKKTARGPKVTGRVVASPHMPKVRKLATPRGKRQKLEEGPSAMEHPDVEDIPIAGPIPIKFPQVNKRGGKVFSAILKLWGKQLKPVSVTTRGALRVTPVPRCIHLRNSPSRTATHQYAVPHVPVQARPSSMQ